MCAILVALVKCLKIRTQDEMSLKVASDWPLEEDSEASSGVNILILSHDDFIIDRQLSAPGFIPLRYVVLTSSSSSMNCAACYYWIDSLFTV
jgi:hypothetical protein